MSPFFSKLITPLIEGLFCLLFFLVPLIMTPFNYELFEYNKMMLTYGLTTIIVGLWLLKMVFEKRIIFTRTPFDIFLWLFLASQIVSTVFSIDVHTSVFGYYSRFNGGLLSIISYVLLFHAFVSNLNQKGVRRVFIAIFSGAFLVSGYAILEHFGIDSHLWVQDVRARVFSTLGQPNWLAGYLAVVILLLCGFISNSSSRLRLTTCYLLFAIFYLSLLYTKSRSGITGFWVADIGFLLLAVVGFVRRAKLGNDQAQLGRRILLVNLLFLVISVSLAGRVSSEIFSRYFTPRGIAENAGVFTGNTPPRNLLSAPTGPDDVISDSVDIRKVVWTGALGVFRRYPIFGSGVETFGYSYYQDRPVEHNLLSEWDFLYNKAHNEYLNFLATTGVVGLGTYLLFLAAAGGWMVTKLKAQSFPPSGGTPRHGGVAKLKATTQNSKLQKRDIITMKIASNEAMEQCSNPFLPLAIFSAWFSILLTNFFGFSVVIQNLFLFLLPAMAYVWETENHGVDNHGNNLSLSRHAELDSASGRNKQILPWRDDKRQVRDDRINLFQKILIVSVLFT
ncbi:MAG: O-antigen ligase family protein, partial [bacterium]|nr:O-antigen ligase family protein [bacterium]